tara:strand:+ start:135 stop:782 length:648 start_codon:yes stop_codon:yes gene_type:complete
MSNENLEEKQEGSDLTENTDETSDPVAEIDRGLSSGTGEDFKWYIAKTATGQENKVSHSLKESIVNHKLTDFFSRILVPEETVVTNSGGKKRTLKKKFFPGYILIKMIMNDRTWHLVKSTDKITGFVGGTVSKPAPISNAEAESMLGQVETGFKRPKSSISFSEGDSVKVIEGPFATFIGTVEAVSDKGKVKVNVSIFGRPTPVELEFNQVEKVD